MTKGFDSATPVGGIVPKIKAAGLAFVGRYFSHSPHKNLSPHEAQALSNAGISIVSVWEGASDHLLAFSAVQGVRDADAAMACAHLVRQPAASTIYFAVDLDVPAAEIAARIIPYFTAVNGALSSGVTRYQAGVYGSGLVCQTLAAHGLVAHTWLGGAMGWAGSRGYTHWNIRQGLPSDPYHFGFQIDPDEAQGEDYGQWRLASASHTSGKISGDSSTSPTSET